MNEKLENLTNYGLLDLMLHQKRRFFHRHSIWINQEALWQKWLRV